MWGSGGGPPVYHGCYRGITAADAPGPFAVWQGPDRALPQGAWRCAFQGERLLVTRIWASRRCRREGHSGLDLARRIADWIWPGELRAWMGAHCSMTAHLRGEETSPDAV